MLVGDDDRVDVVERQPRAREAALQLPQVEAVVDQEARGPEAITRLDDERVAFAAGAEAAESQHARPAASCALSASAR